jgi:hypothetical protein
MQQLEIYKTQNTFKLEAGVKLLAGEGVYELLTNEGFLDAWDALYNKCTWATVFQSRAFVTTWYHTYKQKYTPVLLIESNGSELTGLLPMVLLAPTVDDAKAQIVGAGQYEAEYQVWLTDSFKSEAFIKAALTEIIKAFPGHTVLLRYIPPGVSLSWAKKDAAWQGKIVIQPFRRSLMDMGDPDLSKFFRKSEYRNKLNRLKRLGNFCFERITDTGEFAEVLGELSLQYDFRQGAMFNKTQFKDNPLKTKLLIALFEQGLLHVTVLKVNTEVVASIVAVKGKNKAHLGAINTHSPFYANHSPGFVHFLTLGQQLSAEGFELFDLTAGGDAYKERMTNRHDYVHTLFVASNRKDRLKRELRKNVYNWLVKAGIRPMSAELSIKKSIYLFKNRFKAAKQETLGYTLQIVKNLLNIKEGKIYMYLNGVPAQHTPVAVKKTCIHDFLCFDTTDSTATRWEFLEDAMRRFELGEHSYTWVEQGRLLGCIWLSEARAVPITGKQAAVALPEGVALLQNLYIHPAGRSRLNYFLSVVASHISNGTKQVYLSTNTQSALYEQALNAAGFKVVNQHI